MTPLEVQLKDVRIQETRRFVTEQMVRALFAAMTSKWSTAYQSYPSFVPDYYNYFPMRVVGATVLFALCRYKIEPKLVEALQQERKEKSPASCTAESSQVSAIEQYTSSDVVLDRLCNFWERVETNNANNNMDGKGEEEVVFHGGRFPDLADVEMFGVCRSIMEHPSLGQLLMRHRKFSRWWGRMDDMMR